MGVDGRGWAWMGVDGRGASERCTKQTLSGQGREDVPEPWVPTTWLRVQFLIEILLYTRI